MNERLKRDFNEKLVKIAQLLKEAGCTEVYVLGSALRGELETTSDIDFAVRGLPANLFFRLMSISSDIIGRAVDFIDLDETDPIARYLDASGDMKRVA